MYDINIDGVYFKYRPWTSIQEKHLLLSEKEDFEGIFEFIGEPNIIIGNESLNNDNKRILLLEMRAKSLGTLFASTYKCKHCQGVNEVELNIEYIPSKKEFLGYEVFSDNFEEHITKYDFENLEYEELCKLENVFNETLSHHGYTAVSECLHCTKETIIDFVESSVIPKMASTDLVQYYEYIMTLTQDCNLTIADINDMDPFERDMIISLTKKYKREG